MAKRTYAFELSGKARSNQRKTLDDATELVRKSLAHQPALKRAVDADLQAGKGAPLAKRCIEESIFTPRQIAERIRELGIKATR